MAEDTEATGGKEGLLDRLQNKFAELQQKWPPLAHAVRAGERYQDRKADFFAAGVTYYSVLSLFPLIMVGFAVLGQVLAQNPELLEHIKDRITSAAQGGLAKQLNQLIDSAIASRTTVGVVGLATGLWSGLGWIASLRESLTQLWRQENLDDSNWFMTKFNDLVALVSFGLAMVVVFGLVTLSKSDWLIKMLGKAGFGSSPASHALVKVVSTLLSTLAAWLLFTFVIARLPRKTVALRDAVRGGLLGAIVFEIFLEVAFLVLKGVMNGPAGKTFGPLLGLMVFLFFTVRIILFATAWSATEEGAEARAARLDAAAKARTGAAGWLTDAFGVVGADADDAAGKDGDADAVEEPKPTGSAAT